MADEYEGSSMSEDFDETEEGTDENLNNQDETSDENSEDDTATDDESKDESTDDEETEGDEEVKKTDKGTKLDPNPKSAVHQELANYKREVAEMRSFMTDPKAMKRYIADLEGEAAEASGDSKADIKAKAEEEGLITDPDKIVTPEDFRSYAKFLKKDIEQTKAELRKEATENRQINAEKATGERVVNEVNQVQGKYSVLREFNADGSKNPDFDADLEKEIADEYKDVDFDPKTGKYQGKHSLLKIADRFMRIHNRGKDSGTKDAQTIIADKRHGAIRGGGGKSGSLDESKMSAAQMIASRMARARR